MARALSKSKFAIQAGLFKAEPPANPKDIKSLFCGREIELQRGIETLKQNFDVSGKMSKRADKWPWVIHGESRSGKSHLARRIVSEFPSRRKRIQFMVTAKERLESIIVMRQLFETLLGEFRYRIADQRLEEDLFKRPLVSLVCQLLEKIALFESSVQAVELTAETSNRESFEIGSELTAAPLLSKFLAKYQTETTAKNSVKLSLRPPTSSDLAEVCGIMAETLMTLKLVNHVLILVDDVDLLETYKSPTQNARHERSVLATALDDLHGTPGVDVVLTARSWYVHSSKELMQLVDLSLSEPMSPEVLCAIHDARLKVYGKKCPAFLTDEALKETAGDVEGLPGLFLQHLDAAFYQFQNEDDDAPRDYNWFLDIFRNRVDKFQERCGPALDIVRQAVESNQLSVDVSKHNPFFGTVLDNEFVYQSYWSEDTYFISGLMRKLFTQQAPAAD